jgi:dTDP-4-amino-4,6-dideoxygalactose transaminase
MSIQIPFNRQNLFGSELSYIQDAYARNKVAGDGFYTSWCQKYMEDTFEFQKVLLTTSGTHAIEMAMLLIDLKQDDEVILPSYTFVSTANAVILRGAKPVFVDIRPDTLNLNEELIEQAITPRTKAIMPVHYAGIACDMDAIMNIAEKHRLWVVEDAAQAINSTYKGRYLGGIGHLGCYSFHETKNVSMGEGGALVINDESLIQRAEIIREKGTNRSRFFRGEVDKYTWVDMGSSFLPSDINAAVLKTQLEHLKDIQLQRDHLFNRYSRELESLTKYGVRSTTIPNDCSGNSHMFYLLLDSEKVRSAYIDYMKQKGVLVVFHYVPLHSSNFAKTLGTTIDLPVTQAISEQLVRLPIFYSLTEDDQSRIIELTLDFFNKIQ